MQKLVVYVLFSIGISACLANKSLASTASPALPYSPPSPAALPIVAERPDSLRTLIDEGHERLGEMSLIADLPPWVGSALSRRLNRAHGYGESTRLMDNHQLHRGERLRGRDGGWNVDGRALGHGFSCNSCHTRRIHDQLVPGLANPFFDVEALLHSLNRLLNLRGFLSLFRLLPSIGRGSDASTRPLNHPIGSLGLGCESTGPGRAPSLRIWQLANRRYTNKRAAPLRTDVPCGYTKIPPLNTLRLKSRFFVGGEVNSEFGARWPLLDLGWPGDGRAWAEFFKSRAGQAIDAATTFGTPSLRWEEVAKGAIIAPQADRGFKIFHRGGSCASCHGQHRPSGEIVEYQQPLIPLSIVGTDPERAQAVDPSLLSFYANQEDAFVPVLEEPLRGAVIRGYIAPPLCSPWLNAPFLHTGAVPSLRELLEPADDRALRWWIGPYVDESALGFSTNAEQASLWEPYQDAGGIQSIQFRRSEVGGHSGAAFGTELSLSDKRALLEYLKRLRCPMP